MVKHLIVAAVISLAMIVPATAQDVETGEKLFTQCKACHLIGDATGKKAGPSLNNLFGRVPGTLEGFAFSPAMVAFGEENGEWTPELFSEYIANPRKIVQGTKMAFAGVRQPDRIEHLKAFLLSHSPDYQPAE